MKVFQSSSEKVEVNGETVHAVVDGMGVFKSRALKILADNGIENPLPGKWYNQQCWLNAYKVIYEQIGNSVLYAIGQKIPENAKFPPFINSIHKALGSIDTAYHMNHRNGYIGNYNYEKTGERSAKLECTNPYPDELDRGIITAIARRFKPRDSKDIQVNIDYSLPTRMEGGESTVFLISW